MFCIQCEQTIQTPAVKGCSFAQGMCGKTSEVSDLQDVLVYTLQGVSFWASKALEFNIINDEINQWAPRAFFSTLTNVNFDPERILELTSQAATYKALLKEQVMSAATLADTEVADIPAVAHFELPDSAEAILTFAPQVAVNRGKDQVHEDIIGLRYFAYTALKVQPRTWSTHVFLSKPTTISMPNTMKSWRGWAQILKILANYLIAQCALA